MKRTVIIFLLLAFLLSGATTSFAGVDKSKGQTIYTPVYAKIERMKKSSFIHTSIIFSIRNTDLINSIEVLSLDYHDSNGDLKKHLLKEKHVIKPLATYSVRVEGNQFASEGMADSLIVRWKSNKTVSVPIAEAIVGYGGAGYSYALVFKGIVIEEGRLGKEKSEK